MCGFQGALAERIALDEEDGEDVADPHSAREPPRPLRRRRYADHPQALTAHLGAAIVRMAWPMPGCQTRCYKTCSYDDFFARLLSTYCTEGLMALSVR